MCLQGLHVEVYFDSPARSVVREICVCEDVPAHLGDVIQTVPINYDTQLFRGVFEIRNPLRFLLP